MDNNELIQSLRTELAILIQDEGDMDKLRSGLSIYINELIEKDFQQLVNLLYRLDVNENKVKQMLNDSKEDAGLIIADLIIERQMQKIKTRKQFQQKQGNIDEDEKW